MVEESGRFGDLREMEDVFLLSAIAFYSSNGMSMASIVTRVRQIVKWHARKANEVVDAVAKFGPASLPVLENKGQELARMVAKHLFSTEGFLLLVFQHGTKEHPGYTTHCSSADRRAQIRLLEEHLANLKAMLKASD
jgi:hemoglobin-like flavoprotein